MARSLLPPPRTSLLFPSLPEDVLCFIFQWDPTFREIFQITLRAIKQSKRIYDPSGSRLCIEYECDKDGLRHGVYKEYHKNHRLKLLCRYRKDRMTGTAREFHDNGKLSREYEIDDDRYISSYREFYSNGNPLSNFSYDKSGKIQGPLHQYYPNGNLLKRCWFRDGILNGWCLMFFEDGRPWKQYFCGGARGTPQKMPRPTSEGCSDADPPACYNFPL